jgi:hypothetical protein
MFIHKILSGTEKEKRKKRKEKGSVGHAWKICHAKKIFTSGEIFFT